jgi:putative transposase
MPDYRRWFVEGGTYFFTVVSYQRRRFLTDDTPRQYLRNAIKTVQGNFPFEVIAIVLLPDHVHAVWTLPHGDSNFPTRWRRIKEEFTESYLAAGGVELPVSESRRNKGERGIWQRRYWEHTVRDEDDLKRCVDYIHWNPKKHGNVTRVRDWPYSTFHRFVEQGEYEIDWGAADPTPGYSDPEWGE